ncbi:MAG: glutaminyl-peptide cyclotransferase [Pedobacter sp.]|nr:MAG: glutaminyl-peptide cyclotransferase [Pedobacter sp.]
MHFGPVKNKIKLLKPATLLVLLIGLFVISSCKDDNIQGGVSFKYPEQGQTFSLGEDVKVSLEVPNGEQVTGATYLVDGEAVALKANADSVVIKTDDFAVGYKLITAIVSRGSVKDTLTINIVMKAGSKPALLGYKVVNVFPHDTSSYTQGLEYHDGKFLESTGLEGQSTLRWVNLQTGQASKKIDLDSQYFGEGSTLVGDKIVMLTWKSNLGFVFDAQSLQQLSTFPYQNSREGWGLAYDGQRLIKSDGSNRIYFLNKNTFKEESAIDVYDNDGPVDSINELEYINGKIYANIYTKDYLVVIDPKSGIVEKKIDLTGLLSKGYSRIPRDSNIDVLNGIAWDKVGKRLFVTGKKWPKLFEITLVPQ